MKPKLVRDLIPDIIRAEGREPDLDVVQGEDLRAALIEKVSEELEEYSQSETPEDRLAELSDLLEVVLGLARLDDASASDLTTLADAKRRKRGGFERGFVWKGDM